MLGLTYMSRNVNKLIKKGRSINYNTYKIAHKRGRTHFTQIFSNSCKNYVVANAIHVNNNRPCWLLDYKEKMF